MKKKIIIFLDSGIGGLYIFKKIINIIPKNINYMYIMDNYGFPYGNKNYLYIINRIINITNIISNKFYIIQIIISCNTASIISLKYIKKKIKIPIIRILPNIKLAIKKTQNNNIGLLGTFITINHNYINNLILKIPKKIKIIKKYSLDLVKISENKIKYGIINIDKIKYIFLDWLNLNTKPDVIILGCTHFSFLKKEIKSLFKNKIIFIDFNKKIKKKIIKILTFNKKIKQQRRIFCYTKKYKFYNYFFKKNKIFKKFNEIKNINEL